MRPCGRQSTFLFRGAPPSQHGCSRDEPAGIAPAHLQYAARIPPASRARFPKARRKAICCAHAQCARFPLPRRALCPSSAVRRRGDRPPSGPGSRDPVPPSRRSARQGRSGECAGRPPELADSRRRTIGALPKSQLGVEKARSEPGVLRIQWRNARLCEQAKNPLGSFAVFRLVVSYPHYHYIHNSLSHQLFILAITIGPGRWQARPTEGLRSCGS